MELERLSSMFPSVSYLLISQIGFADRCSNKIDSDLGLVYLFEKLSLQIGARIEFAQT